MSYMSPSSPETAPASNANEESSSHVAGLPGEAGDRLQHYVVTFFAGTLLIAALTGFHILEKEKAAIGYWRDQQSTIADDRVRLVSNWLAERRADNELLSLYPSVQRLLWPVEESGLRDAARQEEVQHLSAFMDQVAFTHGYAAIYLLNNQAQVVAHGDGQKFDHQPPVLFNMLQNNSLGRCCSPRKRRSVHNGTGPRQAAQWHPFLSCHCVAGIIQI